MEKLQVMILFAPQRTEARDMMGGNDFCAKVQSLSRDNADKLGKNRKIHSRKEMHMTAKDDELSKSRDQYSKKFNKHIDELNKKYTSASQRQAIQKFSQTVQSAIELRRTTIDAARADFRSSLSGASIEHREQIDAAETEFINQVNEAFAAAKNDCANGQSSEQAKADFMTRLNHVKADYAKAKSEINDTKVIDGSAKVRDDKIKAAYEQFKSTLDSAKTELENSLNAG